MIPHELVVAYVRSTYPWLVREVLGLNGAGSSGFPSRIPFPTEEELNDEL